MKSFIMRAVDELGMVKAKIAELESQESALKAILIEAGAGKYDGEVFAASVSISTRDKIDWKAIAERFEPSRQLITAHTTTSDPIPTVRVSARSKARSGNTYTDGVVVEYRAR